jgi:hypothetical protein
MSIPVKARAISRAIADDLPIQRFKVDLVYIHATEIQRPRFPGRMHSEIQPRSLRVGRYRHDIRSDTILKVQSSEL